MSHYFNMNDDWLKRLLRTGFWFMRSSLHMIPSNGIACGESRAVITEFGHIDYAYIGIADCRYEGVYHDKICDVDFIKIIMRCFYESHYYDKDCELDDKKIEARSFCCTSSYLKDNFSNVPGHIRYNNLLSCINERYTDNDYPAKPKNGMKFEKLQEVADALDVSYYNEENYCYNNRRFLINLPIIGSRIRYMKDMRYEYLPSKYFGPCETFKDCWHNYIGIRKVRKIYRQLRNMGYDVRMTSVDLILFFYSHEDVDKSQFDFPDGSFDDFYENVVLHMLYHIPDYECTSDEYTVKLDIATREKYSITY